MDVNLFYNQQKVLLDALDEITEQEKAKRKPSANMQDIIAAVKDVLFGTDDQPQTVKKAQQEGPKA
jgi:hypothetical protein